MTEAAAKTLPATTLAHLTIGNQTHEGVCFPQSGSDISDPASPVGCTFEGLNKTSFMTFTVDGFLAAKKTITYGDGQRLSGKCLAIALQEDLTVAMAFRRTAGPCGVPLLNHYYKDVDPAAVRTMGAKANRESVGRFRYDLTKNADRLEDLKAARPHFFDLVAYVADATGVPPEILLSVIDRETHFNPKAHTAVYSGLGQFDKVAWKSVTSSAIFMDVYSRIFPGKDIPGRGEDVFADVLAIAVLGLNASSRYQVRPALTEEFFVTMEACHRKGMGGARRIVKMTKEKRFADLPKGYKGRFNFVQALHRIYERIRIKAGKERIADAT